jgi:hypothetical protein
MDARGWCEYRPEHSSASGNSEIEAEPSYRTCIGVLLPRSIGTKNTLQVLSRADDQTDSCAGITGQTTGSNRLCPRQLRSTDDNEGEDTENGGNYSGHSSLPKGLDFAQRCGSKIHSLNAVDDHGASVELSDRIDRLC